MYGLHEKIKTASKELITKMISKDSREWPPHMYTFLVSTRPANGESRAEEQSR